MAGVDWTLTYQHRQTEGIRGGFDVYRSNAVETKFFDGVAQLGIGPAVTRLELFSLAGAQIDDGMTIERREVSTVLAIPTVAIVELALNIVTNVQNNKKLLSQPIDALEQLLATGIKDLTGSNEPTR